MKKLILGTIFILINLFLARAQTVLYSTDFGSGSLPIGWVSGNARWAAGTSNPSSGYIGFSGSGNVVGTNTSPAASNLTLTYNTPIVTTGYTNIQVQWGGRLTTNMRPVFFEYSVDGGATWFTPNNGSNLDGTNFTQVTNNSIWAMVGAATLDSETNSVSDLRLRFRFSSATAFGGSYSIDDFSVTGTALPAGNTFFNNASGNSNLQTLSNWGTNSDGTGTSPTNFTDANQLFYITNGTNPTISVDWIVSGTNSKVVVSTPGFTIPATNSYSGLIDVDANSTLTISNSNIPDLNILDQSSTVSYSASGAQSITPFTYGNLIVSGSGNKSIITDNTIVQGDLSINSGTLTLFNNSLASLEIRGQILGSGTIIGGSSTTVSINGSGSIGSLNMDASNNTIGNLILNRSGQTLGLSSTLTVANKLVLSAGTLNIGNNGLTISASASGSGILLSNSTGRITYNGGSQNILSANYGILSFTGTGTKTLLGDISVAQNLTIPSPITLSAGSQNISVAGNLQFSLGSAISGTGHTIIFNSSSSQSLLSNGQTFRNLSFPNSNTVSFLDATQVTQTLSITGGGIINAGTNSLNGGAGLIIMNGALRLANTGVTLPELTGTYNITGGNIELYGSGSQTLRGGKTYNNLVFSGSSSSSISSAITAVSGVSITGSAILDVSSNSFGNSSTNLTMSGTSTFKVAGSGTKPDIDGNYFLGSGTTIEFSGTTSNTIRSLSSNQNKNAYENIAFSGSGTHSLSSSVTNLKINGNFTDNSASFNANGGTVSLVGSGSQILSGNPTFYDLYINKPTSGSVTISSSGTSVSVTDFLTVSLSGVNQLNTNGNLTLVSTASQTASLIDNNNSSNSVNGNITVQRYYVGAGKPKFFGSPIASGATVSTLGEGTWKVLLYTETGQEAGVPRLAPSFTGSFRNANLLNSGALSVGRGYSIRQDASGTINFVGAVNNGNVSLPVTNTVGNSYEITPSGFNLLSNPYPSAIDWTKVNANGTGVPTTGVSIWNGSTYTAASKIASGQGFFVKASSSGSILLDNSVRVTSGTSNNTFLRTEQENKWLYLYAKSVTGGFYDALAFTFNNNATNGYDSNYDLSKIYIAAAASSPLLFSRPDGIRLSLDVRPYPTQDLVIPITILVNASGTYSFTTSSIDDWYSDYTVYLKDSTAEGILLTNMKTAGKYEFVKKTTDTDAATRFSIVFKYTPNANISTSTGIGGIPEDTTNSAGEGSFEVSQLLQGVPDTELKVDIIDSTNNTTEVKKNIGEATKIYSKQNNIVIDFSGQSSNSEIEIYDLLGKTVYKVSDVKSEGITTIILDNCSNSAVYIVKLVNNKELLYKKVILN